MISYFKHKSKLAVCEDSLTSTVFDGLKHLPVEIFWRVLKNSLYYDKLPHASGELQSISFWDHWDNEGTKNKRFVEPDVFLRFQDLDIIVEAKRHDANQQRRDQLKKEVLSYSNEYKLDNKTLYLIQLGGLNDIRDEADLEVKTQKAIVCKTDWSRLLDQIVSESKSLNGSSSSANMAFSRVLNDLIDGLMLHGYTKTQWLNEMSNIKINYTKPLTLFRYATK